MKAPAGAFAMGGQNPNFDDIKIGIDNNADDDIADAGDGFYMDEGFGSTCRLARLHEMR